MDERVSLGGLHSRSRDESSGSRRRQKKEIDLRIEKDENKHVSGKKETMNQEGQSNIRNRLMGVFVSVLSGGCFILGSISFIEIGYLRHERIIRIGVCEHRADRKQDFGNCQGR